MWPGVICGFVVLVLVLALKVFFLLGYPGFLSHKNQHLLILDRESEGHSLSVARLLCATIVNQNRLLFIQSHLVTVEKKTVFCFFKPPLQHFMAG